MGLKVGKSPEGKWLVLEGKNVLHTFDTRTEAIEVLKKNVTVTPEAATLKLTGYPAEVHLTLGKDVAALGPDRLNQGWIGRRCSCGKFRIRDTGEEVAVREYTGGFGVNLILEERPKILFDFRDIKNDI